MLGTWLESAKALAKNADDFTKELYELNAVSYTHLDVYKRQLLELVEMEIRELLDEYEFPGDDTPIIQGSACLLYTSIPIF